MWILRERQDPQDLGTDLKWDLEEAEDVGKVTRFLVRAAGGEPLNLGVGGTKEAAGARLCSVELTGEACLGNEISEFSVGSERLWVWVSRQGPREGKG